MNKGLVIKDYTSHHTEWPGTVCTVCGKETGKKSVLEVYKNNHWTFICEDCLKEKEER